MRELFTENELRELQVRLEPQEVINQRKQAYRTVGYDQKLIDAFPGRVVRKDLVYRLKVGFSIPVYVLEYLLGKYCSTTEEAQIREGLESVKQAIKERVVRADQSELIKSRLQRSGSMKLIDLVTVTFDEKDQGGKYWARLAAAGLDKIHTNERIVHEHERTLTGGVWANVELTYDESLVHGGVTRPFVLGRMQPIQIASAKLDEYIEARHRFTRDEWVNVLVRTMGYDRVWSSGHRRKTTAPRRGRRAEQDRRVGLNVSARGPWRAGGVGSGRGRGTSGRHRVKEVEAKSGSGKCL